jgi:hypothetical protein
MAAPTNTTFTNAVNILTFPYTIDQTDINDAGINYTVYYKFIAPTGATVMSAFGYGHHLGSNYQPIVSPYDGPDSAPVQILNIAATNVPIQFPVIPGNEYFLEFAKNTNGTTAQTLSVYVKAHTGSVIVGGDIVVPDDVAGFPAAILSSTIDDTVDVFKNNVVAGEAGDITASGIIALEDNTNLNISIYDNTFTLLNTLDTTGLGTPFIRCNRDLSKFWVGFDNSPSTVIVKTITVGGSWAPTTYTLTGNTTIEGIASNLGETILYFANTPLNSSIKRWDLVNNIALADFATPPTALYRCNDIFVLEDASILVLWYAPGTGDIILKRYNSAGTVLNTYSFGVQTGSTKPRGAYALDNPDSFWLMSHSSTGVTTFTNILCSDGSTITSTDSREYEGGTYQGAQTATPDAFFGNSQSCPFFIMVTAPPPPSDDHSGIYHIAPSKTFDEYFNGTNGASTLSVKIPDPTAVLFPSGD